MSGDPPTYYTSSRSDDRALPPLREIVGDALDRPPISPYRPYSFNLQDVNRALAGTSKHGHFSCTDGSYPQRGPKLPPIRNYPHHGHHTRSLSVERPPHEPRRQHPDPGKGQPHPTVTNPQPATGPLPYSYNVLRAQQGDLVDVRTPSSRAQGILRPTAIIDDEDDSHKRYKCDWPGCEKKYDRPSSLEVHRNTHTGHQPYPCQHPGCPRAFNVKSNMLRHLRSHRKAKSSTSLAQAEQSDSEKEDDDRSKWPADPGGSERYFHRVPASSQRPASSSSTTHPTPKPSHESFSPPSAQYYNSSRRH